MLAWPIRTRPYKRVQQDYINMRACVGVSSRSQACKWALLCAMQFGVGGADSHEMKGVKACKFMRLTDKVVRVK